jgi:hypothetical protein
MSYGERKNIVSIISGIAVLAAYCIYTFGKYRAGLVQAGDLKFWAVTILIFIGVGVAATIVIQIVFHILLSIGIAASKKIRDESITDKEIEKSIGAEMVEDEMDKLIELKAMRFGFAFAGVGFVAALVALVLNYSPVVMLNIMFISFSVGSLLEGFAQLYYYHRGIANG